MSAPTCTGSADQVPSWLYTAVHVTGTAHLADRDTHLTHVDRLAAKFEARLAPKKPWTSDKMDEVKRRKMLTAIVAITLYVEEVHAQKKLVQHKSEAEQRGAAAGMAGRGDASSDAIAELIKAGLTD